MYELKTTTALTSEHEAQLLHYLFLLGIPRGKLINFRPLLDGGPVLPGFQLSLRELFARADRQGPAGEA